MPRAATPLGWPVSTGAPAGLWHGSGALSLVRLEWLVFVLAHDPAPECRIDLLAGGLMNAGRLISRRFFPVLDLGLDGGQGCRDIEQHDSNLQGDAHPKKCNHTPSNSRDVP